MTREDTLHAEANRRRAEFFQSATSMSNQLRPSRLLDDIMGTIDPDFALLQRIQIKMRRNPVTVLAAMAGILLLSRQLARRKPPKTPATRQGMRRRRLPGAIQKGDEDGYNHNAKQH
jgi:hypothetical protein